MSFGRPATMKAERSPKRFSPRRWPVRWRIAGVSAGLTFAILVVFTLVVGRLAVDKLEESFREEAQSGANNVANGFEVQISDLGNREVNPRDVNLSRFFSAGSPVRILDDDGRLYAATPGAPDLGPPSDEMMTVGDYTVATQQIPTQTLGPAVIVQYGRDRQALETTKGRLWFFLIGGILGGTVLAALAGLAVADRAMRPIASLTAAAREIGTTRDPSRRIPMPDTDDEVAELARTLDQMLRELDAARGETELMIQAQRDFVADASHELRTPLTSILANLELLEERLVTGHEADTDDREIVAGALGSSRRMRRLVSDLLLLARADAGRSGPRRDCDLSAISSGAITEVRPVSGEHSLILDAPGPLIIEGNPDDLHRLAVNLIENAVRHTPHGCTVRVSVRGEAGQAVLEVSDNGPGIPEGMADQIFARFVRGSGPADLAVDSGTGLGLAIVKAVAHSHGGSVEAANGIAGGAHFTVRVPLDEQALTGNPQPAVS